MLRLAEAENPTITLGREAIQEALALQLQARAMLLPSLNGGAMYHLQRGTLQAGDGQIEKVDLQSVYFGGGDWAVGSQTVAIPAVHLFGHVGDAYFLPLVAHQVVNSRAADSRGIENAVLLEVARRYLDLIGSQAALFALRRSEDNLFQIVHDTAAFARTGQGRVGDYNRARTDALLLHSREQRAQETVAVASADLARTLHLDPSIRLVTAGAGTRALANRRPDLSRRRADSNRPECTARGEPARAADISAADFRLRQEYARPFPPDSLGRLQCRRVRWRRHRSRASPLSLRAEAISTSTPSGRCKTSALATRRFKRSGVPNAMKRSPGAASRSIKSGARWRMLTPKSRHAAGNWILARKRLRTAANGAREEVERTRGGEGLPLEAVNSINLLVEARDEYIRALVGYDVAEFILFVAIGETPNVALTGSAENRLDARRQPLDAQARALPFQGVRLPLLRPSKSSDSDLKTGKCGFKALYGRLQSNRKGATGWHGNKRPVERTVALESTPKDAAIPPHEQSSSAMNVQARIESVGQHISRKKWLVGLGFAVALILFLVFHWSRSDTTPDTDTSPTGDASTSDAKSPDQSSPGTVNRVDVVRPRVGGMIRTITEPGTVKAFRYADLYAKVSGFLEIQNVDIGDSVKPGQLLAKIFAPELVQAVDQAKAQLDQARAKLNWPRRPSSGLRPI